MFDNLNGLVNLTIFIDVFYFRVYKPIFSPVLSIDSNISEYRKSLFIVFTSMVEFLVFEFNVALNLHKIASEEFLDRLLMEHLIELFGTIKARSNELRLTFEILPSLDHLFWMENYFSSESTVELLHPWAETQYLHLFLQLVKLTCFLSPELFDIILIFLFFFFLFTVYFYLFSILARKCKCFHTRHLDL